jgi:ornithine carbamoyltransferase
VKLYGKHLLSTQDWHKEELSTALRLAALMKQEPEHVFWRQILTQKSFLMLFYNPSLRTHLSFETAATQLGGHAQYRTGDMGWVKTTKKSGESIKDIAQVMSRYVNGIGIRLLMGAVPYYGAGHQTLLEYAAASSVPIISMADDRFHPCQALADLMTWAEWQRETKSSLLDLDALKGKKLLLTWAKSGLTRPWSSVQSHLLLASSFGMNITLARPQGYDLDPEVYQAVRQNCQQQASGFEIIDDPDAGYDRADVVFVRNWISPNAYQNGELQFGAEIDKALAHTQWMTTAQKMKWTNNAIFANPMPVDRGNEVTDEVADGSRSVIYDTAENRLHVQKALMALTMSDALDKIIDLYPVLR